MIVNYHHNSSELQNIRRKEKSQSTKLWIATSMANKRWWDSILGMVCYRPAPCVCRTDKTDPANIMFAHTRSHFCNRTSHSFWSTIRPDLHRPLTPRSSTGWDDLLKTSQLDKVSIEYFKIFVPGCVDIG